MWKKNLEKKKHGDFFPLFFLFTSSKFDSTWWLAVTEILEFYF